MSKDRWSEVLIFSGFWLGIFAAIGAVGQYLLEGGDWEWWALWFTIVLWVAAVVALVSGLAVGCFSKRSDWQKDPGS